jgi:glycosyltransferase involved in cell wall biosynthesis
VDAARSRRDHLPLHWPDGKWHGLQPYTGRPFEFARSRPEPLHGGRLILETSLNIVHYSPYALAGETGSGNSIRAWCEALAHQGLRVRLVVDERQIRHPPPAGISCETISHRLSGRASVPAGLRDHLVDSGLLVVHGGWTLWNIVACRDAAVVGVPYLITTHGVYNPWVLTRRRVTEKRIWNLLLERRHLSQALALHLFFEEERRGLRSLGVTSPTIVAPNGISAPLGVRWNGGSGGYLLWLGRFDIAVKGLDLLVRSLLECPKDGRPTLRLHGPDFRGGKTSLVELVRDLGLEHWVKIRDPIYGKEKWETISRAAGYVHPSRWDTSPMAVAEAVGSGVPTLVTDYPLGRLLASKGAAVMCERSPQAIANGIERLLSEEGARIGRTGMTVAAESLSWDRVARSWREQVEGLMRMGTSGP